MKSVKGEWLECWANGKCQSPGCFQYKLMIGFANGDGKESLLLGTCRSSMLTVH